MKIYANAILAGAHFGKGTGLNRRLKLLDNISILDQRLIKKASNETSDGK